MVYMRVYLELEINKWWHIFACKFNYELDNKHKDDEFNYPRR